MARSLNKVTLIGNLTRDPELRYTPQGTAVCTLGLATNRQWVTESGEKKDSAEFLKLVAWNKLAEICSQLLTKGRKIFVEGRLQTRSWTGQDGAQRTTTEIVINEMIILDSKRDGGSTDSTDSFDVPENIGEEVQEVPVEEVEEKKEKQGRKEKPIKKEKETKKDESEDEIPF